VGFHANKITQTQSNHLHNEQHNQPSATQISIGTTYNAGENVNCKKVIQLRVVRSFDAPGVAGLLVVEVPTHLLFPAEN